MTDQSTEEKALRRIHGAESDGRFPLGTSPTWEAALPSTRHSTDWSETVPFVGSFVGSMIVRNSAKLLSTKLSPDLDQVAQALARKFGWRIQPSGAVALEPAPPLHAGARTCGLPVGRPESIVSNRTHFSCFRSHCFKRGRLQTSGKPTHCPGAQVSGPRARHSGSHFEDSRMVGAQSAGAGVSRHRDRHGMGVCRTQADRGKGDRWIEPRICQLNSERNLSGKANFPVPEVRESSNFPARASPGWTPLPKRLAGLLSATFHFVDAHREGSPTFFLSAIRLRSPPLCCRAES